MEKGFAKQEVVTSFDSWRRGGRVIPVGLTEEDERRKREPKYGYLNFEDPNEQTLIDLADAYLALRERGIDPKKILATDKDEEGGKTSFDPELLKTTASLFSEENAKKKIHAVILACYPDIRRVHEEALAVHKNSGESEESFISPLESFKPFRKVSLLAAAGEQLNG